MYRYINISKVILMFKYPLNSSEKELYLIKRLMLKEITEK